MRVVAILQARLGGTRLPGKVLLDLCGKSVVRHCVQRLQQARLVDTICVAVPHGDQELIEHLAGIPISAPPMCAEDNVLGRMAWTARHSGADIVVRATADNPFVSWTNIDRQVATMLDDPSIDYVWTAGLPVGVSAEVIRAAALLFMDEHVNVDDPEREHVTRPLRMTPAPQRTCHLLAPPLMRYPQERLTIDYKRDYENVQRLYEKMYDGSPIPTEDAVAWSHKETRLGW